MKLGHGNRAGVFLVVLFEVFEFMTMLEWAVS
jgi:hypothetical protein